MYCCVSFDPTFEGVGDGGDACSSAHSALNVCCRKSCRMVQSPEASSHLRLMSAGYEQVSTLLRATSHMSTPLSLKTFEAVPYSSRTGCLV